MIYEEKKSDRSQRSLKHENWEFQMPSFKSVASETIGDYISWAVIIIFSPLKWLEAIFSLN